MKIRFILLGFGVSSVLGLKAQSSFIPTDEDSYHIINRIRLSDPKSYPEATSIRPFYRSNVGFDYTPNSVSESKSDLFNYQFIIRDNWDALDTINPQAQTAILKNNRIFSEQKWNIFYERHNAFFSVNQPDFKLIVNPVLDFHGGVDQETDEQIFRNTRGVELRGTIGNKVGFYSFMSENQVRFADAYDSWIDSNRAVPGAGFLKEFGAGARDFLIARGYITVSPIKQIGVQFGHDRNFIGNGYRSLILSDFAKENLFLKLTTKVWRIQYMNLFNEYTDRSTPNVQRKKYGAFHYLNINILPGKLDVGVFEHIMFLRDSSGFDVNYLNPIIFYRTVEHSLNSSDNALLGMDFRFIPRKKLMFYGQLVLDEFHKNELINRTGSWVNKWAAQLGGLYIDVAGIKNLDLRVEANLVRPYTYTHKKIAQAYTHYNQPIAHPFGANFREVLGVVKYQPFPRITLTAKYFNILHGADSSFRSSSTFYGGNLLNSYQPRPKDDGIKIGDGVQEKINIVDLVISYQFRHRGFIDLRYVYRNAERQQPLTSDRAQMILLGLRLNIDRMALDY